MRLLIHLDEGDRGTPIEIANEIIKNYTDRAAIFGTDDAVIAAHEELSEIAEHIRVYLRHNKPVCDMGVRCKEE